MKNRLISTLVFMTLFGCSNSQKDIKISESNIKPGTEIKVRGKVHALSPGHLEVGENFIEKTKKTDINFAFKNKATVISIVPSIDTPVCEAQTHLMGETNGLKDLDLVIISRDLPMAQTRFAKEAKLENLTYLSDYKSGSMGSLGLKIKGSELLARGVVVLDKEGIVRYMQFVEEVTDLPNMPKAFAFANAL